MKTTFKLEGEYIELQHLLKKTGLCSTGGMAKMVTIQGLVKVDDRTELRRGTKIKKGQRVEFEENVIVVE